MYKKKDGSVRNIIHTRYGVYMMDSLTDEPLKISDNDYSVLQYGHIDGVNAFDEYFFTSLGSNIFYWNTAEQKIKKLEGTFDVPEWKESTSYSVGDIVKPTEENDMDEDKYTGLIYKCIKSGTSDDTEPTWPKDMVTQVWDGVIENDEDNRVCWIACGSLELEGQDSDHISLRAQCIELFKGFLFVGNTVEGGQSYPTRLRWSQWQNPRLWHNNEDGSGLSGYVDVDDTDGEIVALKRIGDVLYIYKDNSIIAMTYTGDPDNVFSKEVVTTQAGVIAPEAIVELPHMNIFIGQDDIYMFDGNTCTGIGDNIKDWFFQKFLDQSSIHQIFGYYDEKYQEVIFGCNKQEDNQQNDNEEINNDYGIVYNLRLKTWSVRQLGVTALGKVRIMRETRIDDVNTPIDSNNAMIDAAVYAGAKAYTAAGDKDGNLFILNDYEDTRYEQDGYEGYVVSKTHHMEEPGKIKRLMRIQFHIETVECGDNDDGYSLYCQVGTAWSPENKNSRDIEWTEKKYLNLKKPVPWYTHHIVPYIDVDLTARYFMLRFGTTGNNTYFRILGYTLYYQVRGDE